MIGLIKEPLKIKEYETNAFRYLGLALMAVLTLSLTSCEVEIDSFMMMIISVVVTIIVLLIYVAVHGWVFIGMWTVTVAVRNSTFIWTGQALILFGWNILMDMWRHSNIISGWNWENYAQTSIRMDYGRNDVSYLDDVYDRRIDWAVIWMVGIIS